MKELTISVSALTRLVEYLPNPDDPDPIGPLGPIARWLLVALNPQPLPPHESPLTDRFAPGSQPRYPGPHPEPWTWVSLTRATISKHLDQLETATVLGADISRAQDAITTSLTAFIDAIDPDLLDDVGRPVFPGPRWWPVPGSQVLDPVAVLAVGLQFQHAADALTDSPLHDVLEKSADRLLTASLKRFDS